jgi:hypothetical protein
MFKECHLRLPYGVASRKLKSAARPDEERKWKGYGRGSLARVLARGFVKGER